jgi:hypothetical protein
VFVTRSGMLEDSTQGFLSFLLLWLLPEELHLVPLVVLPDGKERARELRLAPRISGG